MESFAPYLITLGRLLLAPVFLQSGVAKIVDYAGTQALMEANGLPGILIVPTIILEVLGSLFILCGLWTSWAALALAGFCVLAAFIFHLDFSNKMQTIQLLENIAMAGGLLALAGAGPGAFALDNRRA